MAPLTPQNVRNPMKRFKNTAIGMCLLATLSVAGCVCMPGYYPGVPRISYGPQFSHGSQFSYGHGGYGHSGVVFDDPCSPCAPEMACDPCGPEIVCGGVVEFGGNFCVPQHGTIVDCRSSLSNICSGVLLIGRGVRDMTAKPFIVVGKILSSGCRYEVIAHCPEIHYFGSSSRTVKPCCAVTSGCDSCNNGYFIENDFNNSRSSGRQFDTHAHSRMPLSPPMLRMNNSIIQATHVESITPGVRFVQPR